MGPRYVVYRLGHEIKRHLGITKSLFPEFPDNQFFLSLQDWRNGNYYSPVLERSILDFPKLHDEALENDAQRVLNGEVKFFNAEWKNLGPFYDWITNVDSGYQYDTKLHWSQVEDFSLENGDIKYVWEKSRFTYLITVMRYDYHYNEDHSAFVFNEIESWIDANPINMGPNWRCSQEISLRLINWSMLLGFYKHSNNLDPELWEKIQNIIYWSLHHVYHNINFSRIAVRNNHAITETMLLALSHYLFPYIEETRQWSSEGRRWFEQEIHYQIYPDGTFLQFSMNYHRVLIQLLSFALSVASANGEPFSKSVYQRAHKALNFIYQCIQEENGRVPNYGSNDGSLFFPLSTNDYNDYRPQVNHLHWVLTGASLYPNVPLLNEDYKWLNFTSGISALHMPVLIKLAGTQSFPDGGYYILRTPDQFTFIRCGRHKDRPAHADNLHLDIWIKGVNVLQDAGTYKYNVESNLANFFTGTGGHNTVALGDYNQMLKGSRFIWYYWSQSLNAYWSENEEAYIFEGNIRAFRYIGKDIEHKRKIIVSKNELKWEVVDELLNTDLHGKQFWHTPFDLAHIQISNKENIEPEEVVSFESVKYGVKRKNRGIYFPFNRKISSVFEYLNEC